MALTIRLRQQGRNNRPFYRLVLTDVRNPRDGKYVEALGWYNPFETELDKSLSLDTARIQYWLNFGAIISERAEALVKKVSPAIIHAQTQKAVALRAKAAVKRKARKKAAA
ncbi:MAG: 30S ribosomal protein S16 [Parachlamydiaceae bacterium]